MLNTKAKAQILLLDNYDSFTYNLYDYISQLGGDCTVIRNDEIDIDQITKQRFDAIVLAPGPQRPRDAGVLMKVLEHNYQKIPILGVCLGMQAIGEYFGAKLVHAKVPMHGKVSKIFHKQQYIFEGLPIPTEVMRYHSLVLRELPSCLECLAQTAEGEIMAIRHKTYPLVGVQFHPESILTKDGMALLNNWIGNLVLTNQQTLRK